MSAIKDRSLSTATSLFSKPFTKAEALAAPLLQVLDLPCGTFHLNGTSGDGKSSILKAAASVYGGEERVTGWDKTKNGFEAVADLLEANAKSVAMADLIDANAKEE